MNQPPLPADAEGTLRESERRYRDLVEGARNAVFRLSDEGDVSFLNRTFEAMTGWPAHHWVGRPFSELVYADDRGRAAENIRRTLAGESPIPFDLRVPVSSGTTVRVLEVTLVPQRQDDTVVGVIGTATDVTERRLLEADAARQERQLAVAQQLARLGSFEWDVRSGVLHWSDQLCAIYGILPEHRPRTLAEFVERVVPEDRATVESTIRRALDEQGTFSLEERIRRPDGSVRQLETRGEVVRDEDGRPVTVIGSCQDVTERRQQEDALRRAEAEYRQLMESVQAIVWRADAATFRFRYVSHEAEPLLRYPLARWLEPGFWQERLHPEDRDWMVSLRSKAAAERRDHEAEYRMIGADGRVVWLRDVVRVRAGDRRAPELFGVTIDVTERRRAEEELRRSREQLSDLSAHLEWVREEERAGIAREIHDELGQALTALRLDVAWLRSRLTQPDPEGPPREAMLGRLASMVELIDETITCARRISAELRPGVLDDLGLEAAVEWQAQEFEGRTGVRCAVASNLRDTRIDRDVATALFRILQESLTNVARHAKAASVRVDLRLEGGWIVLEVADDGCGSPPEQLTGRRSLGVLGMKERARRLGGTLTWTSAPSGGTVVRASIPRTSLSPAPPSPAPRLPAVLPPATEPPPS